MTLYDAAYQPGRANDQLAFSEARMTSYDQEENGQFTSNDDSMGDEPYSEDFGDDYRNPMLQNVSDRMSSAVGFGGQVFEYGKQIFYQQRQCVRIGEGPKVLRALCFIGGLAMFLSSILSMINILTLVTGPTTYVLQMYQGFFGIVTMIVETKGFDLSDQVRPWLQEWFKFITVPAGKGAFYIFVGSLGVSLWVRNFLSFTVGMYVLGVGLVCLAVHFGQDSFVEDGSPMYRYPIQQNSHRDGVGEALAEAFHDHTLDEEDFDAINVANNNNIISNSRKELMRAQQVQQQQASANKQFHPPSNQHQGYQSSYQNYIGGNSLAAGGNVSAPSTNRSSMIVNGDKNVHYSNSNVNNNNNGANVGNVGGNVRNGNVTSSTVSSSPIINTTSG